MHHDEHQSQGKVLIGPVKIKIIRARRAKKVQKAPKRKNRAREAEANSTETA